MLLGFTQEKEEFVEDGQMRRRIEEKVAVCEVHGPSEADGSRGFGSTRSAALSRACTHAGADLMCLPGQDMQAARVHTHGG